MKRIRLALGRGIVRLVSDGGGIQVMQISLLKNEVRSGLERFQEYGFSANPHPGAEAVVNFLGGDRSHGIVIAVDDRRYRIKGLATGEVAIYTDEGDSIILKRGNNIEVNTQTFTVNAPAGARINTPRFEVSGDIIDQADANAHTMDGMREIYNSHTHDENNTSGATDAPNQRME